jgi:hypothetical protein
MSLLVARSKVIHEAINKYVSDRAIPSGGTSSRLVLVLLLLLVVVRMLVAVKKGLIYLWMNE